jgi:mono/diheme cytochrome c family protein
VSGRCARTGAVAERAAAGGAALAALAASLAVCAAEGPQAAYPAGLASFQANCAVCHGPAGAGVPALAPPLLSYPLRYAASAEGRRQLVMTVLYGMIGDITVEDKHYNFQMPEFRRLDDATLAATLNFVVFELGHAAADIKPLTSAEIAAESAHVLDGAAVREHRRSVVAAASP